MDFVKIITDILKLNTHEEIQSYISNLKITVPKEEFINILQNKSLDINLKIKNYIIQNGDQIILIFDFIRKIKQEFFLLKKSFETMKNQMIILKKKYIEPFEKLQKALTNKTNIEKMMLLFENAKKFKENMNIIKSHYEKGTLLLSSQNYEVYLQLSQTNLIELKGILFIKEEYDWFNNTLFVICSDHTNQSDHQEYQTDLGVFAGPVIFYAPSDSLMIGRSNKIAQQIDVMPTILSYLGYNKQYVAFGCDLLTTPVQQTLAVSYCNGVYQYLKNGYLLQFDGQKTIAIYSLDDTMMIENLLGKVACQRQMEDEIKAIVQQYMQRMNENNLIAK